MRVLVWANSYRPRIGGVEVFLSELAPALQARGHEVRVITDRGPDGTPDREEIDGVPVERLGFNGALASGRPAEVLAVGAQALRSVQAFDPDVIHLNFSDATIFFHLRASAREPRPTVLTFHLSPPADLRGRRDGVLHRSLAAAAAVTACSRAVLTDALEVAPERAEAASVIPNGLRPPPAEPVPAPPAPVVFAAGRLVEEKGFDVLIDALPELIRAVPEARLVLAGEGPERDALAARARRLGVDGRVDFRGWVAPEAIDPAIRAATAVAIPSRWREPFCLVALEAALAGRPAVASRVGGLPEVVVDGQTGLLVGREDPGALAAALARGLGERALAERLGTAARARALAEFGIDRCAERYEAVFAEAAA